MKKTVVALAVLAASGASMAQSSVSLYGIVDVAVGSVKSTIGTTAPDTTAQNQNKMISGGLKSSRWGMKGTEDLGGGLKAGFVLESGFDSTSGAGKAGYMFDRAANLSLSGDFGSVALGRMATPYDSLRGASNPIGDTNMSPVNNSAGVYKTAGLDYADKMDSMIAYQSPVFNGFSGSVGVKLGGDKTSTIKATQNTSLQVRYANGPLMVGYGYQQEQAQNTTAVGIDKTTFNLFAASYDFGVAKLVGNFQTGKLDKAGTGKQADEKGYTFGVAVPVASNANVFFGYAHAKYDAVTGTDYKSNGYTLAANYVLSKRTDLYAGYKTFNKKIDATGADLGKSKTFAVGVRHTF